MTPGPAILFWDTETAPLIGCHWGLYEQNISYPNVIQDWFIISAAWKWQGSKKTNSVSVLDDPKRFLKNHADDYYVVKAVHDAISEADIIVAHNNDGFDYKKFMARVIYHKLPPIKRLLMVDTLKEARRYAFSSRKLDDLCSHLSLARKLQNEPGLWPRAASGDKGAIRAIVRYNNRDIPPLEQLYDRLLPYMPRHPNHNLFRGDGVECCPNCGSTVFKKKGFRYTSVGKFQSFECQNKKCRARFQSGKTVKRVSMR